MNTFRAANQLGSSPVTSPYQLPHHSCRKNEKRLPNISYGPVWWSMVGFQKFIRLELVISQQGTQCTKYRDKKVVDIKTSTTFSNTGMLL